MTRLLYLFLVASALVFSGCFGDSGGSSENPVDDGGGNNNSGDDKKNDDDKNANNNGGDKKDSGLPTKKQLASKIPGASKKVSSLNKIGKSKKEGKKLKKVKVNTNMKGIGGKSKGGAAAKRAVVLAKRNAYAFKVSATAADTFYDGVTAEGDTFSVTDFSGFYDSVVYTGEATEGNEKYAYTRLTDDTEGFTFIDRYTDLDGDGLIYKAASGNPRLQVRTNNITKDSATISDETKVIELVGTTSLDSTHRHAVVSYEFIETNKAGDTIWAEVFQDADNDSLVYDPDKAKNNIRHISIDYPRDDGTNSEDNTDGGDPDSGDPDAGSADAGDAADGGDDFEFPAVKMYADTTVKTVDSLADVYYSDIFLSNSSYIEYVNGDKESIVTALRDSTKTTITGTDTLIVTETFTAGKDSKNDVTSSKSRYAMIPGDLRDYTDDVIGWYWTEDKLKDDPELDSLREEFYPEGGLKSGSEPTKGRFLFTGYPKAGGESKAHKFVEEQTFDNDKGTNSFSEIEYDKDGKEIFKSSGTQAKDGTFTYADKDDEVEASGFYNDSTGAYSDTVKFLNAKDDNDVVYGIYSGTYDNKADTGSYSDFEVTKGGDTSKFVSSVTKEGDTKTITEVSDSDTTIYTEKDGKVSWKETDDEDGSVLTYTESTVDGASSLTMELVDKDGKKVFESSLKFAEDGSASGTITTFDSEGKKEGDSKMEIKADGTVLIDGEAVDSSADSSDTADSSGSSDSSDSSDSQQTQEEPGE